MASSSLQIVPPQKVWSYIPAPPRRELLWLKEGKKCHWCGRATRLCAESADDQATIEHIIPRYKGGTNEGSNLASACRLCNNRRAYEDSRNMKEGALLGKWPLTKSTRKAQERVALTGDEKKAIIGGTYLRPNRDRMSKEEILLEQRDQAHRELTIVRNELKLFHKIVEDQEKELKSMTVGKLIRKRIADWLLS